jgi:hypothetical protein
LKNSKFHLNYIIFRQDGKINKNINDFFLKIGEGNEGYCEIFYFKKIEYSNLNNNNSAETRPNKRAIEIWEYGF